MRRKPASDHLPGALKAPPRSRLLSILSRQPLRRFFEPAERRLKKRLSAPFAKALSADDSLCLVYHDEQIWMGQKTKGMSSRVARRNNIQLVLHLLEEAGIRSFAVPDQSRRHTAIGVEDEDWEDFVSALQGEKAPFPAYVGLPVLRPDGTTVKMPFRASSPEVEHFAATQLSLPVFQFYAEEGKALPFGLGDACVVERWFRTSDGSLETENRNNRFSAVSIDDQVPASVKVNELDLKTFAPFAETNVFELTEPIDAVFMWVDGQDSDWRLKRNAVVADLTGTVPADSFDPSRFRDNGELRYSFRSLFHHCEWIRNIILVSDSQVPSWLDATHPRIRLVNHQELFGDDGKLPTFNSHAIAGRIHHIEGLSNRYIIMNDDVFIGHSIGPEKFFTSNGNSRFFLSQSTLPRRQSYVQAHESARKNAARLIQSKYGKTVSRIFWHTPIPQQKSLLLELEREYPDAFTQTWSHQLRSPNDFEINGWMHHYVGYIKGRTIPGNIRYDYFSLDAENLISRLEKLYSTRDVSTFCINDTPEAPAANLSYLEDWLERYFPIPAPWELDRRD